MKWEKVVKMTCKYPIRLLIYFIKFKHLVNVYICVKIDVGLMIPG